MSTFDDHQHRIWNKMIVLLDEYIHGKIEFSELVNGLEGLLNAGEFKDEGLVKIWYQYWSKLEIHNAVALDERVPILKKEVEKDVKLMKNFLVNSIT